MPCNRRSSAQNNGFTLLEVLVSILVLSIGIFGALKMHLTSLQTFQQANYFRSALVLALDLSDNMLGNPEQMKRAASNPFLNINYQASSDQITVAAMCHSIECNSDQLASAQITDWLQKITEALPDVHAVVCRDETPWNVGKRQLEWDCHASSDHSGIVIKLGWTDKTRQTSPSTPPQLAIPVVLQQ